MTYYESAAINVELSQHFLISGFAKISPSVLSKKFQIRNLMVFKIDVGLCIQAKIDPSDNFAMNHPILRLGKFAF